MTTHSKEFTFSETQSNLCEIANEVAYAEKRVILTRKKNQPFPIVSIEDLRALEAIEDQIDLDDARKTFADTAQKRTVSWESIKRKLDLWHKRWRASYFPTLTAINFHHTEIRCVTNRPPAPAAL